ncbi:MAG: hypothetical protein DHS80DRAFT_13916, partial [Piptocephalis tieghemiana]
MASETDSVLQWDTRKVFDWINSCGFGPYASHFVDQRVTGDVLVHLAYDTLQDLHVESVGHRISLLKAIYDLKCAHQVEVDGEEFHPYDVNLSAPERRRYSPEEQEQVISNLVNEVARLNGEITKLRSTIDPILSAYQRDKDRVHSSPSTPTYPPSSYPSSTSYPQDNPTFPASTIAGPIRVYGDRLPNRENESFKTFRITGEDPCWRVLELALRKYDIQDSWNNYSLLIIHGVRERYMDYSERPLSFFQRLQAAGENPIFMMRHNK